MSKRGVFSWLERLPVTPEAAGLGPVARAKSPAAGLVQKRWRYPPGHKAKIPQKIVEDAAEGLSVAAVSAVCRTQV